MTGVAIGRGRRAFSRAQPSPVGGWNARDPVDKMDPLDAIQLDNYVPRANYCELRRGTEIFARNFPAGPVQTIMEYDSSAVRAMLAAGGGKVASISDDGLTVTSLGTGFTSDRWQWLLWKANLLMFNGADTPQKFDGSTLSANTFTGTGLTPANLIGAIVYRERLFAWEAAKPWFWYGGTGSISGALTKFDLTQVASRGGNLKLVVNWTRDGGTGIDDLIVFVMSTGEALVYAGGDPGDASDWAKQGNFRMAPPLSIRGADQLGGDVVIATKDGAASLNTVLPLDRSRQAATISDKIRRVWLDTAKTYGANDGWEVLLHPGGGLVIFNIPISTPTAPDPVETRQYAMNTDTGAWCQFIGMNVRTLGLYRDEIYAGGNEEGVAWNSGVWNVSPWYSGVVAKLFSGYADLALGIEGNQSETGIQGDIKPAFFDLGAPGANKRFTMARPVFQSDGNLTANIGLSVDYADRVPSQSISSGTEGAGAVWNVATWDLTDWSTGYRVHKAWKTVYGIGFVGALGIRTISSTQDIRLMSIDYMAAAGGIL